MIRRLSAHLGYMFADMPLRRRFEAAARAGFVAVEHPGPYDISAAEMRGILSDNGLVLTQIALPAGDAARGEKGLAVLAGRDAEFEAALARGLDYASETGCRMVHMMSGVVPPDVEKAGLWPLYIERLNRAAQAAAARDMTLLIEPIGIATLAGYFMDDPYDALRALDATDAGNVRLLFDAFHATNAGVDANSFARNHIRHVAHVHIADHPGRHEPGTGLFDFARFFAELERAGYEGWIGLEYIPAGDTARGLDWIARYAP